MAPLKFCAEYGKKILRILRVFFMGCTGLYEQLVNYVMIRWESIYVPIYKCYQYANDTILYIQIIVYNILLTSCSWL